MTGKLKFVKELSLANEICEELAVSHGMPREGWGVLSYEGGVELTDTTTLVAVKTEEEEARELADQLQATRGKEVPYQINPDAGQEYFRRFGVAPVSLWDADIKLTFHYAKILYAADGARLTDLAEPSP